MTFILSQQTEYEVTSKFRVIEDEFVRWRRSFIASSPPRVLVITACNSANIHDVEINQDDKLRISFGPGLKNISQDGLDIKVTLTIDDQSYVLLEENLAHGARGWTTSDWISLPTGKGSLSISCEPGPEGKSSGDWLAISELFVCPPEDYTKWRRLEHKQIRTDGLSELNALGTQIVAETRHYNGGVEGLFEVVGRDGLITLIRNGLLPSHRVLDFGCGSLRLGYWLIRFLDPDRYYGLEPIEKGVTAGMKILIGDELKDFKRPTIRHAWDSDITAFEVPFDYIVARSILTHTCPGMLRKILSGYATSSPDGMFFASYWRLDGDEVFDSSAYDASQVVVDGDDLPLDDMRFVTCIKYSLAYMQKTAKEFGLVVDEYREFETMGKQIWLRFRRADAPEREEIIPRIISN